MASARSGATNVRRSTRERVTTMKIKTTVKAGSGTWYATNNK
jgi:hypothetical protein